MEQIYIFSKMLYLKMSASNFFLLLLYIIKFSAQSHGIQIGLNSTCTFGPGISFDCNKSPMLAIRARIDRASANEDRIITLMFVVPENRGEPCLSYRSSQRTGWTDSCTQDINLNWNSSYGNGNFSLSFTESDLFSRNEAYWLLNISGRNCPHEICTLRLNASNLDDCCTSTSSLPFEIRPTVLTVSPPDDTTNRESPSENESVSPVVYSVIIVIVVLVALLILIYVIQKFYRKRQVQKAKFYEWDINPAVPITIFVAFLDEHPTHKQVVLKFANYLKEYFRFKIILELYNREAIYENPTDWLEKSLSSSNIVLVIWSSGANERWNNPEKFTDRLDLFTPVLKRIKQNLSYERNLSKYMVGQFEYSSNEVLPKPIRSSNSITCVTLMTEFNLFCQKLVDVANSSKSFPQKSKVSLSKNSVPDEAVALEESISEMKDSAQLNGKAQSALKLENQVTTNNPV